MQTLVAVTSIGPVLGAIGAGALLAFVGHLVGSPRLVGVGIAVMFCATVAMFAFGYVVYQRDT